jgi:hypothetical protein
MSEYILTKYGKPVTLMGEELKIQMEDPLQLWLKEISKSINVKKLSPERILKSGTATIVFWSDGTKTIVKRASDEPENEYTAFTAALAKKVFGSNNAIKKIIERKTEVQKPKNDHN